MLDHYVVLGVPHPVTAAQAKAAYFKRAKICHPDTGGTHEQFLALQAAYDEVLKDIRRAPVELPAKPQRPKAEPAPKPEPPPSPQPAPRQPQREAPRAQPRPPQPTFREIHERYTAKVSASHAAYYERREQRRAQYWSRIDELFDAARVTNPLRAWWWKFGMIKDYARSRLDDWWDDLGFEVERRVVWRAQGLSARFNDRLF